MESPMRVSQITDFSNDLLEYLFSFLPNQEILKMMRSHSTFLGIASKHYNTSYLQKEYQVMKMQKRKTRTQDVKEQFLSLKLDPIQEYGNVVSRRVVCTDASIKLNPMDDSVLLDVTSDNVPALTGHAIYTITCGGWINVAHTFDGKIYYTSNNDVSAGFRQALLMPSPVKERVISVSTIGKDLVYLTSEEWIFTVLYDKEEDKFSNPIEVDVPEPVKTVSAGNNYQFALTHSNRVYGWIAGTTNVTHVQGLFDTKKIEEPEQPADEFTAAIEKPIEDEEEGEEEDDYETRVIKKIVSGGNFTLILYEKG
jgi:alpha-tubulin suppressor-like RCC1 family protein